jgi:glycosyltransferase involved in cell wall biosynthesis
MKIAIVDRYFFPDLQATAVYLTEIACTLGESHNVTVYCGAPSGFQSRAERWFPNKLTVKYLLSLSLPKANIICRALNYVSFIFFCFFALLFAKKPDVLMVQTTPPLNAFFVAVICRFRNIPMVYVCNDLFPETARVARKLKEGALYRSFLRMNRFALETATKIIALGGDMKERLLEEGIPQAKIKIICPWADTKEIVPSPRENAFSGKNGLTNHFVVMHAGNMGYVHGLEVLIEAAYELRDEERVLFVFVGNGAAKEKLVQLVKRSNLNNVRFIHFAAREELNDVLASADLHCVCLEREMWGYSIPSKIYTMLASGRPVLTVADLESDVSRIVEEARAGVVCSTFSAPEIAAIIIQLLDGPHELREMGENGRRFMEIQDFKTRALAAYREVLEQVGEKRK